ncbi:MAG: hypothetical protein ABFD79_03860 [Phycisphaerales bacterium]
MKTACVILRIVGTISCVLAVLGFLYNIAILYSLFVSPKDIQNENTPYFYLAYSIMTFVCIVCYVILLICGIHFIRLRTRLLFLFAGLFIFEFFYIFLIGISWVVTMWLPEFGKSIASATGLAIGGLSWQIWTLFPLWAPILAWWASKRILKPEQILNQNIQQIS